MEGLRKEIQSLLDVITLTLGSQPTLGLVKVWAKNEARSHISCFQECEEMNLHTPKWTPTLGIGVLMDFWILKEQLQRSKPIGLRSFYIIKKLLELKCPKRWARMTHLNT